MKAKKAPKMKKATTGGEQVKSWASATVLIDSIKPHPQNYRKHPEAQLAHIEASIREHGFYRNIVVARDGTILAGHGVVEAARKMGLVEVPVVRLDLSPTDPRALKLLAGDNEVGRLAEVDGQMLSEILSGLKGAGEDALLGTGFGTLDLDRLIASLGAPMDVDAEWEGMPEFVQEDKGPYRQILMSFKSDEDAEKFAALLGQTITKDTRFMWYPPADIIHVADKRYKSKEAGAVTEAATDAKG
jgi:hypothetical protein